MENGAAAEGARSQWGFTYPSLLVQCMQSPAILDASPGAEELVFSEPLKAPGAQVLRQEGQKQEEQKSETAQASDVKAAEVSSVADAAAAAPADCSAAEESAPPRDSSDPRAQGQLEQQVDANPVNPRVSAQEEVKPEKPNFSGTWDLVRTEGDWDKFMSDMGLGWLSRNAAKALRYGVGRVVLEWQQDGDNFTFSRVLCDPSKMGKSSAQISIGQGPVRFFGDLGYLTCSSQWEGSSLRNDSKVESSGLAITSFTYFSDAGDLVEEIRSSKGSVAKNIFSRRDLGGARRSSVRRSGQSVSSVRSSILSMSSAIRSSWSLRFRRKSKQ